MSSEDKGKGRALVPMPLVDELMERIAIRLQQGDSRVFAMTDHIGGFWEDQSFAENQNGGYTINGHKRLKAVCVNINGTPLPAETAERFEVYPYQTRRFWNDGTVMTTTVLAGQHGMIMSISTKDKNRFSVVPDFENSDACDWNDSSEDSRVTTINMPGTELVAAVGVSSSGSWGENGTEDGRRYAVSEAAEFSIAVCFDVSPQNAERKLQEILMHPEKFVAKRRDRAARLLMDTYFETGDLKYDKALHWAKISSNDLVVSEYGKGIWAGLSWFHQGWGRDTFISLPGTSIVTGQFEDAKEIIRSFASFQINDPENPLYGRVPNRVCSPTDIIYNTTDGTPWLVREIGEYVLTTGDREFAEEMFPVVKCAIEGVRKYYLDEKGFMVHADADTWMDAKREGREPWSARGNRAVDIQALWYTELQTGSWLAEMLEQTGLAEEWKQLANTLKTAFRELFYDDQNDALYDHLNADDTQDRQIRPNQMFAVSIPLFDDLVDKGRQAGIVKQVVSELCYPHGVASLSQNDEKFHPYHHDQIYYFDAAYHNGLCWQWIAGPVITGMTRTGFTERAYQLTSNLADQILNEGMPGSLSELVEPLLKEDGTLQLSGTYSQAWSVAEFVRNFYQDYLGIKANMLTRTVQISPRLPAKMEMARFIYNLGHSEKIAGSVEKRAEGICLQISGTLDEPVFIRLGLLDEKGQTITAECTFDGQDTCEIMIEKGAEWTAKQNNQPISIDIQPDNFPPAVGLEFQRPWLNPNLKSLHEKDFLEKLI